MGNGYFGKLPARKDFVIGNCPKGFLKVWEPFLIGGLAQSRLDLKEGWKEAYMTMPVWRFLLAPCETAGTSSQHLQAVAGAFMPSVDGAGREYPLTVIAETGCQQAGIAEDWFDQAETVLRSALQEDATLAGFRTAVADLKQPEAAVDIPEREEGLLAAQPDTEGRFGSHFWCRAGEVGFAFRSNGLPDACEFRWLMLPEHYQAARGGQYPAGDTHGRYHPEDHRT